MTRKEIIKMKKLFKIFLCFVLTLLIFPINNISANEGNDESGFTERELEIIREMEECNPTFKEAEGEVVLVEQELVCLESLEENLTSPRAVINSNYLLKTTTAKRLTDPGYDNFLFTTKYDWVAAPVIRLTEAVALYWSDNFSFYNHNLIVCYNSLGERTNTSSPSGSIPEYGVSYTFDCSISGHTVDYVILNVKAKKNNTTGTANLCSLYVHPTIKVGSLSIVLQKGSDPIVDFGVSGTYDYLTDDCFFSY